VQQTLLKTGRTEEPAENYVLVEDVQKSWDQDKGGGSQRVLDAAESVLLAQNKWRGGGRFLLRKKSTVRTAALAATVCFLTPLFTDQFSGPCRAVGQVCLTACLCSALTTYSSLLRGAQFTPPTPQNRRRRRCVLGMTRLIADYFSGPESVFGLLCVCAYVSGQRLLK